MSEHHTGPVEQGAPMDYLEHERTYNHFIAAAKLGTAILVALLIGMAAGFYTAGGFIGGLVAFIVLSVVGVLALR